MPIQGTGADMVKLAMIMMRNFINECGLQEDIFLVAQVHDQITTMCRMALAEWWKVEMDRIMCEAAKVIIPTGILRAETTISAVWTK
jgi:DNA polymerase I-like protein with 3'-5' exonuclease and polymerase domains